VVAPGRGVAVANLFAAGGLFRGDLLGALYLAAMATPTIVAVAALAQTRRGVGGAAAGRGRALVADLPRAAAAGRRAVLTPAGRVVRTR
jgi:hypothetical protein